MKTPFFCVKKAHIDCVGAFVGLSLNGFTINASDTIGLLYPEATCLFWIYPESFWP
jgi:hypothetical protein